MLRICSFLVLSFTLTFAALPVGADQIAGQARVIDGDTIEVVGQRIRLAVVDAPEMQQTCDVNGKPVACGAAARHRLLTLLAGRRVQCDHRGAYSHKRAVANCDVGGVNVTLALLSEGIGKIDHRFLNEWPRFAAGWTEAEARAEAARRGLWQGHAVTPSVWRNGVLMPVAGSCVIKGNINDKGERIYHSPSQRYYDSTRISKPGERFFCSESEARVAGFRRSKV